MNREDWESDKQPWKKILTIPGTERPAPDHLSHITTREKGDPTFNQCWGCKKTKQKRIHRVFQDDDLPNVLKKTANYVDSIRLTKDER